ncbi:tyrosine--tRNA ligase [Candidatus Pacearchaeota archaeon CG06_land_8_20_14_3_00_35_12]|nr:MAG: tyrosine--tRNA ligase [Candidatus Pacearchaeota archaeon CG06_land_8_20_14_3_00_35_12]
MDVETRLRLIKEVGEEIITEEELRTVLETKSKPIAYDGFEPSGLAHIPFGLLRAENLKNMLKAGIKFKLYLADYFAFINNKLGGDMERIRTAGEYFIEVWKACGVDTSKVEIVWASQIMDDLDYWDKVLKVAKETTIKRSMRATTIMGRQEGEIQSTAQLFYPSMQVTDVFHLDVDICQLGLDQRRANILAREVAEKLKWKKPVLVHHHMILGLQGIKKSDDEEATILASKMSKSKPETCIYMHDSEEEIKRKISSAFCLPKIVEGNPIFDYLKNLIFKRYPSIKLERPQKFGGNIELSYNELEKKYLKGDVHPLDLKNATAFYLNEMINPVRDYFKKNTRAKKLYETVKQYAITR